MSDDKNPEETQVEQPERRNLLAHVAKWTPPVIMVVTLPAHAQTSPDGKEPPDDENGGNGNGGNGGNGDNGDNSDNGDNGGNGDNGNGTEECDPNDWDRSSLKTAGVDCNTYVASFCNGEDSETYRCDVPYRVYYDSDGKGNVYGGSVVDSGTVPGPVAPGECKEIDFSSVVAEKGAGKYGVQVDQHPLHPGTTAKNLGECVVE